MLTTSRVRVYDIPNLDAEPDYELIDGDLPFPRIRLPSGHLVAHLTRYNDVKKALADQAVSRTACNVDGGPSFLPGPTQKELLLNLDMPHHARSRNLVSKDFSPRGVEALRVGVSATTYRAIDEIIAGKREPDLFHSLLQDVTSSTVCQILGIPLDDREMFRQWSQLIQIAPRDNLAGIEVAVKASFDYLMDFVRGRRQATPDGFINAYLKQRPGSETALNDEELVGVLLGILLGGEHNSLSVMTKCVYTMLCAPSLWIRMMEERDQIPLMIEELIRMIPIGRLSTFPRIATRDLETSVGLIPAGTALYANAFLANRDPEVFADPMTINFDRKDKPHLQFGFGIHSCMGPALARMEIAIVLRALVEKLPSMTLAVEPRAIPWINGTVLRRPDQLPIRFAA
jgi:cytochrome P450